jgi:bifunctional UDP-N-acetylglucosamine pyrophosphorylase / glucosamine-1-phosphate N-acetyltransferase
MEQTTCIILAAGLGKRMGSHLPKVLAKTDESTLIEHVLHAAAALNPMKTVIVTGHGRELVEQAVLQSSVAKLHREIAFAFQEQQLGTGHAVLSASRCIEGFQGNVAILYGDAPLLTPSSLDLLVKSHEFAKATVSLLSFEAPFPNPYGRIIRSDKNQRTIERIVEAKDCSPFELLVREVNSGIYLVESSFLLPAVKSLTNNNVQKEYYLTDIVAKATQEGQTVCALCLSSPEDALGVNSPAELAIVNRVLGQRRVAKLTAQGVNFLAPESCFIDPEASIEAGALIGPNVQLKGRTKISREVVIEGSSIVIDSSIGERTLVKLGCRIENASIGAECSVGPFAHVRPKSILKDRCKIGNFVEMKNAHLAEGVKAGHLTYLGDCEIGAETNIGAGTITCNYDGASKHTTKIGERAFIGSDSCLVAPVEIGSGSYVGAGSVITKNVEPEALAFTRAPLVQKAGWAARKQKK